MPKRIPDWHPELPKDPRKLRNWLHKQYLRKLNAEQREREQKELIEKIKRLNNLREQRAKQGGFLDIAPEVEKGIFLHAVKIEKGVLRRIIYNPKKIELQAQADAAENLRKELKFYSSLLKESKNDIILHDKPNLFVFMRKSKFGAAKVVVEKNPNTGITEHTTYYFDKNGKLVIEHIVEKYN